MTAEKLVFGQKPRLDFKKDEVRVGECFFNLKRKSCLRVMRISDGDAQYQSWRPNGSRISAQGRVSVKSLRTFPYVPIARVTITLAGGEAIEVDLGGK